MFKFNFQVDENEDVFDIERGLEKVTIKEVETIKDNERFIETKEFEIIKLPPQTIEVEGIRPKLNLNSEREFNLIYKRYLSDIKLHLAQQDSLIDTGSEQDEIRGWIDGLDVVRFVYEGGFKTWESALDLSSYLFNLDEEIFKNKNIIELGCGSAIPSLTLLRNFQINKLHFSDYNKEVLYWVTLPNLLANRSMAINTDPIHEEVEVDIELDDLERLKNENRFRLFEGDWNGLPKFTKTSCPDGYDIILTTETIYSPELIPKLYNTLTQLLKKPDGIAYVAAKTFYFGVGGGTLNFKNQVLDDGLMKCETVFTTDKGVTREILKVTWI